MRLVPLACIALAAPLLGCTSNTIEPSPEALAGYVTEKGPSGFLVHESGGRTLGLAVVKVPTIYYCSAQNGAVPSVDDCVRAPSFVGRLGTNTTSGTKGSVHCVTATVALATNFIEQHGICVSTAGMEAVVKNTPLGDPLPFEVAAGAPFYHLLFKSDDGVQEALLNLREADGTAAGQDSGGPAGSDPAARPAATPSAAQTECERLAANKAAAESAANQHPSARTLQAQAMAQVEMIASGCLSGTSPAQTAGSGAAARPVPKAAEPQPAPAAAGGFLERELADIANACNYSARLQELYDAYGPTTSWDESGDGSWAISLASPDGGAKLSPEFGRAEFTLNEDEGYTHLSVPVQGGSLYGLPVSELAWSKGLENGISVFSVGFALELPAIRARMAERGIELKAGEYDEEMMMSITPELVRNGQTGISYLVCNEST